MIVSNFKHSFNCTLLALVLLPLQLMAQTPLTLSAAIELAQHNDPWLIGNHYQQQALAAQSVAASVLPDPQVSIGLANLPTDSFDFRQENMTQLKVGVSQQLPRGKSLALQSQKLQELSEQNPYLRSDRRLSLELAVSQVWLDLYQAEQSLALIESNRALFEQLVEVSEASYSNAYGRTQQQDIIRAQLELSRLQDSVVQLRQKKVEAENRLSQWLQGTFSEQYLSQTSAANVYEFDLKAVPDIVLYSETTDEQLKQLLLQHPAILADDSVINASQTDVKLAEQQYKPQWALNASYAYRDDTDNGQHRADFLSFGVSFDVPLNTNKKQDKQVQAAIAQSEAVKTNKWLLLRKMLAEFHTNKARLEQLNQRQQLYKTMLLPQIHQQAEAALSAYTNDEADFSEVVRAHIDLLNAEIDELTINVEQKKTIAQLNYFIAAAKTGEQP